jgi:hypothetical protein
MSGWGAAGPNRGISGSIVWLKSIILIPHISNACALSQIRQSG